MEKNNITRGVKTRHKTYLTLICKQLMTMAAAIKLYIKMRSFHHHTHSLSSTEVSNLAELLCNAMIFSHEVLPTMRRIENSLFFGMHVEPYSC